MNCFVIMPFADEFDDVYGTIKTSVEKAMPEGCRCFRLDESRPAGRITDRLLRELRSSSFCVADLTGNRPNVMWEVGYAMALERPTIVVTQNLNELPFDLRDMQSLEYERKHLSTTLGRPLQAIVIDTLSHLGASGKAPDSDKELIGQMLSELTNLKGMVAQAVRAWNPTERASDDETVPLEELAQLEGAWRTKESRSHSYATVIDGDLIVPYCYQGDGELTGVYYGWRRTGNYWFARFTWLNGRFSGFAFLKQDSMAVLRGAWWHNMDFKSVPDAPPEKSGVAATWERLRTKNYPGWAADFLDEVKRLGLAARLTRR